MSSIFDSVDTAAARRKNRIMETGSNINASFFLSSKESGNNDKNASVVESTSTNINTLTYKYNNEKTNTSFKKLQIAWFICIVCLFIPFFIFIHNSIYCKTCDIENIKMLPYDCSRFYLGLFVTLPGASVYIFCSALFFYRACKLGVAMCTLSVFIFVFTIENSCMHTPYVTENVVFYLFCSGIAMGITSQYIFFLNLQNTDTDRFIFLSLSCIASLVLFMTITTHTAFIFIPSTQKYTIILCYRIMPLTFTFFIHMISTFFTSLPVDLVVTNLIL